MLCLHRLLSEVGWYSGLVIHKDIPISASLIWRPLSFERRELARAIETVEWLACSMTRCGMRVIDQIRSSTIGWNKTGITGTKIA